MKIRPVYWIALALTLALTVAVCDGLRLRDKYSIAIGKYQATLDQSKKDGAALTLQIGDMQAIVGQKDKAIAELKESIVVKNTTIEVKNTTLTKLQSQLAQAKTDTEKVPILTAMVENWRAQYNTATLIITDKDAIIAAWAAKFNAQVVISDAWKQKYESELHLRTLAEKGWKVAERKLKWTRIIGNVKTGLILAAVAAVGYEELKGKVK